MTKIEIIDAMAYREFRDKRNIYYELRELVEGIETNSYKAPDFNKEVVEYGSKRHK